MLLLAAAPPAYVGISMDDRTTRWRLAPSRSSVRVQHGRRRRIVAFSVQNYGQDAHDLTVKRAGASTPLRLPVHVASAVAGRPGLASVRVSLPPGRYLLYCSIGYGTPLSHVARGMSARFAVARAL